MSIKYYRTKHKISSEAIAKIIGIQKITYYKKERGEIKFTLDEARKIALHFNEKIENIFYMED